MSTASSATKGRQPLPETPEEKIAFAVGLKKAGNDEFKNGNLSAALQNYKKVFLYVTGLHGPNSEMRGFFNAMGADQVGMGGEKNELDDNSQEEEINALKIDCRYFRI